LEGFPPPIFLSWLATSPHPYFVPLTDADISLGREDDALEYHGYFVTYP